MRTPTLLIGLGLVAATFAFLPSADASMQVCVVGASAGCGGIVCTEQQADGQWTESECVTKRDLDRCQFQSDCCASTGFWCPETE